MYLKHFLTFMLVLLITLHPTESSGKIKSENENVKNTMPIHPEDSVELNQFTSYTKPIVVAEEGKYLEAYNLYKLEELNGGDGVKEFQINDMRGDLVNRVPSTFSRYGKGLMINSSSVILFEVDTQIKIWNMKTNVTVTIPVSGHHDVAYNPKTKSIIVLGMFQEERKGQSYLFDIFYEFTLQGILLWSFNTSISLGLSEEQVEIRNDVTHTNSLYWDIETNALYASIRNLDYFVKINKTTSEVIWKLGLNGDFALFNKYGEQKSALFYHAHSVKLVGDNTFILFDNDLANITNQLNFKSRILEITINENTMTANETWSWGEDADIYSPIMGSAGRLPNGNRYGLFPSNDNLGPKMIEVDEAGNIVHSMTFKNTQGSQIFRIYQMEKYLISPYLTGDDYSSQLTFNSLILNWTVASNYHSPYVLNGTYKLFINGSEYQAGEIEFPANWETDTLSIEVSSLGTGVYNATLAVYDDAGRPSIHQQIVEFSTFFLESNEFRVFEEGDSTDLIWNLRVTNNVSVLLDKNSTEYNYFNSIGGQFSLNKSLLAVGIHNISIRIINGSTQIFFEQLIVSILSAEPPEILNSPFELEYVWSDLQTLNWTIFDISPDKYELRLNNIAVLQQVWISQNNNIEWTLPLLDEGQYNLSLILFDRLGQSTVQSLNLSIISPSEPTIVSQVQSEYSWGETNTVFVWQVHAATIWKFYRNNILFSEGIITNNEITISISDWYSGGWYPQSYEFRLVAESNTAQISELIDNVTITFVTANPYANKIIESEPFTFFATQIKNILGAPDSIFASISYDYDNGAITVDMGLYEQIINGAGPDFRVHAIGEYGIEIVSDLNNQFESLGVFSDITEIDLSDYLIEEARFVKIRYVPQAGGEMRIDAIEAINYNTEFEIKAPEITGPSTVTIEENEESIDITWQIYDAFPWNYSVYEGDELKLASSWRGESSLTYTYYYNSEKISTKLYIHLLDLEGSKTIFAVSIFQLLAPKTTVMPTGTTLSDPSEFDFTLINYLFIGIIVITVGRIGYTRYKNI